MSVMIHPKDSGPIDTTKGDTCANCKKGIRRRNDIIYRRETRHDKRTQKYLQVCPYCNGDPDWSAGKTYKHKSCRKYFAQMKIKQPRHGNPAKCPQCSGELTEENTVEL